MSKEDPTPPRILRTPPQNSPVQVDDQDSDTQEEDIPDIWSDELFQLNIVPFSDDDNDYNDPDYIAPEAIEITDSTSSSSEEDDDEEEDEEEEAEDNMAAPAPPPAVSGGQLSSVSPFTGNQGLDGLVYVEAIDRAREQFGWTQVQTARAAVTRGGNACLLYTSPSPRD